jgi:hypothetical protein
MATFGGTVLPPFGVPKNRKVISSEKKLYAVKTQTFSPLSIEV